MKIDNAQLVTEFTRVKCQNFVKLSEGQSVDYIQINNQFGKIGTWEYHIDDGKVFWSPEVYHIHGLPLGAGPVNLKQAIGFYHPEDARRMADVLAGAVKLKSGFHCKLRLRRHDGSVRLTESVAAPVLNRHDNVVRLVGTFQDITEQAEAATGNEAQSQFVSQMIASLPIPAAQFDRQMRYIRWNPQWLADLNYKGSQEIAGRSHFDLFPDLAQSRKALYAIALKGQAIGKDNDRIERASGLTYLMDWRMQPWTDKAGDIGGIIILARVKYVGAPKMPGAEAADPPMDHFTRLLRA